MDETRATVVLVVRGSHSGIQSCTPDCNPQNWECTPDVEEDACDPDCE